MSNWNAVAYSQNDVKRLQGYPGWERQVFDESLDPFYNKAVDGVAALERINALEKARAVPYISIQQVKRESNEKIGPDLMKMLTAPPKFGESLGSMRFGERPGASLQKITVKTINPTGLILYREIDMTITVHRPNAVFSERSSPEAEAILALLSPGNTHVLKYGWRGSKAVIVGGSKVVGDTQELPRAQTLESYLNPNQPVEKYSAVSNELTSTTAIRFVVTHYGFTIGHDGQIELSIHGMEDGELHIRNSVFLDDGADVPTWYPKIEYIRNSLVARINEKSREKTFFVEPETGATAQVTRRFIKLKDALDILTAPAISKAFKKLGYSKVDMNLGVFNGYCPETSAYFASSPYRDQPIADFDFPVENLTKIIDEIITNNEQVTVYNIIRQMLGVLHDPATWSENKYHRPVSVPELSLKITCDPDASRASVWIVDSKRYLTKIAEVSEHMIGAEKIKWNAKKIDEMLAKKKIPKIRMGHRNSFIKDARFEVVQDELMKSIFIQRAYAHGREGITNNQAAKTDAKTIDSRWLIYSSAIQGQVQMLGNFVFETFGMMWIDFGVRLWDGFFFIKEKVDTISLSGFESSMTVVAQGSNPLGLAPAAPPVTAPDWIKERQDLYNTQAQKDELRRRLEEQRQFENDQGIDQNDSVG